MSSFIKQSMVTPTPGMRPALPRYLTITAKLVQHRPTLEPFLNSIPVPFTWAIESPDIASAAMDELDVLMQHRYKQYMDIAQAAKAAGNDAFNRKDRAVAMAKYTEAISVVLDALSQRPTDQ